MSVVMLKELLAEGQESLTVEQLREVLEDFDPNAEVFVRRQSSMECSRLIAMEENPGAGIVVIVV